MTIKREPTLPNELSRPARAYALWIWEKWGVNGKAFFEGQDLVALRFGVNVRTVRNWEKELREAGVIERKRRGRQGREIRFRHALTGSQVPVDEHLQPEATFRSSGSLTGSQHPPNRKLHVTQPETSFRRLQVGQESSIMTWPDDLDRDTTEGWDRELRAMAASIPELNRVDHAVLARALRVAALHFLPPLPGAGVTDPARRKSLLWAREGFNPVYDVGVWLRTISKLSSAKDAPGRYLEHCLRNGPQGATGAVS